MKQDKKSSIQKIQEILLTHGFSSKKHSGGIKLNLDVPGISEVFVNFCFLPPDINSEDIQDNIHGIKTEAEFDQSYYFGCKGSNNLFFFNIYTKKEPEEEIFHHKGARGIISQLNDVDSKMFRQELDRLGLSRSGAVRLALTRIFREMGDARGLLSAIADGAESIVKAGEQDIINNLLKEEKASFISNIVQLLWERMVIRYLKVP